jgi:hypothetical protein
MALTHEGGTPALVVRGNLPVDVGDKSPAPHLP